MATTPNGVHASSDPVSFVRAQSPAGGRSKLRNSSQTGWSGKTLMWLLICLVAIAISDDVWSTGMASPSRELLFVADDDDTDGSAERMPACASGRVGFTNLPWLVGDTTEVRRLADLRNGFRLRYGPALLSTDRINESAPTHPAVGPPA